MDVVGNLVRGGKASDDDVILAIESGITILRAVRAIPRQTYTVYHPGVELCADPHGKFAKV
jgi:hypothetical protein